MPTFKLRIPSNRTLANICVYGAIASVSAVFYMHWKLEDRVRNTDYYKLAINTLRQHKGAVGLLGEPIKETGFDLTNKYNSCDSNKAQFEVKVNGSKDKGKVFFWATNKEDRGWLIDRLELETNNHPEKRFLLKRPSQLTLQNDLQLATMPADVKSQSSSSVPAETTQLNQTSPPPPVQPDIYKQQSGYQSSAQSRCTPQHQNQHQDQEPLIATTTEGGMME